MATIPESHHDLLTEPVFVTIATVMPDGQPQLSVVWCNSDGEHVLVNTARGRQKELNVSREPKVTVMAVDPDNPYRFMEVRGEVAALEEDGAIAHIDKLAQAYLGKERYYGGVAPAENAEKETRVILKIKPTRVRVSG